MQMYRTWLAVNVAYALTPPTDFKTAEFFLYPPHLKKPQDKSTIFSKLKPFEF